jgi:hypothetical protein
MSWDVVLHILAVIHDHCKVGLHLASETARPDRNRTRVNAPQAHFLPSSCTLSRHLADLRINVPIVSPFRPTANAPLSKPVPNQKPQADISIVRHQERRPASRDCRARHAQPPLVKTGWICFSYLRFIPYYTQIGRRASSFTLAPSPLSN